MRIAERVAGTRSPVRLVMVTGRRRHESACTCRCASAELWPGRVRRLISQCDIGCERPPGRRCSDVRATNPRRTDRKTRRPRLDAARRSRNAPHGERFVRVAVERESGIRIRDNTRGRDAVRRRRRRRHDVGLGDSPCRRVQLDHHRAAGSRSRDGQCDHDRHQRPNRPDDRCRDRTTERSTAASGCHTSLPAITRHTDDDGQQRGWWGCRTVITLPRRLITALTLTFVVSCACTHASTPARSSDSGAQPATNTGPRLDTPASRPRRAGRLTGRVVVIVPGLGRSRRVGQQAVVMLRGTADRRLRTDGSGVFSVALPAGPYSVSAHVIGPVQTLCPARKRVTVLAGGTRPQKIVCLSTAG